MVTAKVQYSLATAKGYFAHHLSAGDYYEEGQKTSGEWFGLGAQSLELTGRIAADDFVALCENQNPITGQTLTQRNNSQRKDGDREVANRRVFYDFTFSPPKSVSIAALVAEDARILESHHRALKTALKEFEQFAATRVRQKGANDQRLTRNVVAALFTHDTSRALDPHLHTHCIVFNATHDPEENKWKALQNYEMLRARKYVENVYYHELAKDLRSFGYRIRNQPRGDFEIEGVSEVQIQRFSKRHEQIDHALEKLLANKPELARGNLKGLREALATTERARKTTDISRGQLRVLWNEQMQDSERQSLRNLAKPETIEPTAPESDVAQEAITWAEDHLFDRRSTVLEHELWQQALEHARGQPLTLEALKKLTKDQRYLRDEKDTRQLTTKPVLAREWEIVATAMNGISQHDPFDYDASASNTMLDGEQQQALSRLLQSRDFISLFRGGAGTGKSFVLRELVKCLENGGHPICVLAPQRQQVADLDQAGFPKPTTVADFLTRKTAMNRGVVIVDEAGQIGARQMVSLIRQIASFNGRLILSGDTRQHGPVETSDALVAIEKYTGIKPAELGHIRRQDPKLGKTEEEQAAIAHYRQAVEAAAEGKLQESFDHLDRMGAVVCCRYDEQQQKLADQYLDCAGKGQSIVVVSQTWSEVHRVNEQVRSSLKEKVLLGGNDTVIQALEKIDLTTAQKRDPRFYTPESIVVFNQKVKSTEPGSRGRFVASVEDKVLIDVGKRIISVPHRNLDKITVCRQMDVPIASGERLQLKANRKQQNGATVTNGELVTVRAIRKEGGIELADGRVLDADYREFVPGYAVTSYGSQGKTVDYVLFSDSSVKAATNDQQWYVTISRGRKGIRIFTPDKPLLRESVIRSGKRTLALDIVKPSQNAKPVLQRRNHWLRRFGRRASQLLEIARRFNFFNRNPQQKLTHEHQTARMLVR